MEVEGETASKAQPIERTRCLDGKLLIDRLLELAGIQNDGKSKKMSGWDKTEARLHERRELALSTANRNAASFTDADGGREQHFPHPREELPQVSS